jgi:uncharacterized protein YkwD
LHLSIHATRPSLLRTLALLPLAALTGALLPPGSRAAEVPPAATATTPAAVARPAPAAAPATTPRTQAVAYAQPRPAAPRPAGDPYGFVGWLNATRASYGLPPVGYDPNLERWASMNNSHQSQRGIGHYVMGPARRQNSAMGSFGQIGPMWMNSPAHRSALLDPSIRWIGLAGWGAYWTFNAS